MSNHVFLDGFEIFVDGFEVATFPRLSIMIMADFKKLFVFKKLLTKSLSMVLVSFLALFQ